MILMDVIFGCLLYVNFCKFLVVRKILGILVSVVEFGIMLMICNLCVLILIVLLRCWFIVFDVVILFGFDGD